MNQKCKIIFANSGRRPSMEVSFCKVHSIVSLRRKLPFVEKKEGYFCCYFCGLKRFIVKYGIHEVR
ncbi:hypothetical protein X975_10327, partial [Stegodyphus mimosarum]